MRQPYQKPEMITEKVDAVQLMGQVSGRVIDPNAGTTWEPMFGICCA